jgi:hypothetical protein
VKVDPEVRLVCTTVDEASTKELEFVSPLSIVVWAASDVEDAVPDEV